MAKRTTITIEITSTLVVRAESSGAYWCPQCAAIGEMVAFGRADAIAPMNDARVAHWFSSREVHRSASPDGSALICLKSLLAHLEANTKLKEKI